MIKIILAVIILAGTLSGAYFTYKNLEPHDQVIALRTAFYALFWLATAAGILTFLALISA